MEALATPAGTVKAPASEAEVKPSAEVAAWRVAQKARASGEEPAKMSVSRSAAAAADYLPEGQGEVPWHQILDTRLNDALVARVNVSNGNLMLAATDFDIAGVGQKLQLTRTYNSFEAPRGSSAAYLSPVRRKAVRISPGHRPITNLRNSSSRICLPSPMGTS
ncbi:hypothetical protein ACVILE_000091 [Streptomyces sp. M18.1]